MDNKEKIFAVVGVIEKGEQILVAKKENSALFPNNGWHIPGGKIENGETEEQALLREIKEEVNIAIRIKSFLASGLSKNSLRPVNYYLCEAFSENIKPGSDVSKVKFIDKHLAKSFCDIGVVNLWPKELLEFLEK